MEVSIVPVPVARSVVITLTEEEAKLFISSGAEDRRRWGMEIGGTTEDLRQRAIRVRGDVKTAVGAALGLS